MNSDTSEHVQSGPRGWANWRAAASGAAVRPSREEPNRIVPSWTEYTLYSDAPITGELTAGPYRLWNTIAHAGAGPGTIGEQRPVLVLRATMHLPESGPQQWDLTRQDVVGDYGGGIDDELAALLSLALGFRLRSGGATRHGYGEDLSGTPTEMWHRTPRLEPPVHGAMLPHIAGGIALADASDLLDRYASLDRSDAIAIVRAARQFEEGLWIADADPRIAWIKIIGGLETAANQWNRGQTPNHVDRLRRADPELAEYMEALGTEHLKWVAGRLADTSRALDKFIRFTCAFAPGPPTDCPENGRFDWASLQPALRIIYRARSSDLQDGIPFPGPMCAPPQRIGLLYTETQPALAVAGHGGMWPAASLPMHLHLFARIAGGAIRSWWASL